MLKELHMALPRIKTIKALARSDIWLPNIYSDITYTVNSCYDCQMTSHALLLAPIYHWKPKKVSWSRLHVDFAGPFYKQHFLIVAHSNSKRLEIRQLHHQLR